MNVLFKFTWVYLCTTYYLLETVKYLEYETLHSKIGSEKSEKKEESHPFCNVCIFGAQDVDDNTADNTTDT